VLHSVYSFRRPNPEAEAGDDARRLRRSLILTATVAAVLWLSKLVEAAFGLDLVHYGVYPRKLDGLAGILWAPLIHGSFPHLIANTVPIVVLGTALLYGYPKAARIVVPVVYLGSGAGVWLFARDAYHIGASGLSFGMMFFVFTVGVLRRDRRALGISLAVFFLYGGMLAGLFPGDPGISFEGHISGAVCGIALAILLKRLDPPPPEKKYSWELDASEADNQRPPQY
jgi:membrane associated rhomboid family serine protease